MIFISNWNELWWFFSMHFNASRKSLSGGFWNTSGYLAKNHDLAQTAFSSLKQWNFGIRQKREFYDIDLHIYSFFEVSVTLICSHIIFSFRTNSYSNAC